jgi:flagellar biosynthesis/type III secretory pathway protein FliH
VQLSSSEAKLLQTQLRLGKKVRSLNRAKRNLTTMSKDLAAAKKRADESYASGYSTGTSTGFSSGYSEGNSNGYSNGYSEGNSSGYNDGLYAGSDSLECSDDPDVDWLPACY